MSCHRTMPRIVFLLMPLAWHLLKTCRREHRSMSVPCSFHHRCNVRKPTFPGLNMGIVLVNGRRKEQAEKFKNFHRKENVKQMTRGHVMFCFDSEIDVLPLHLGLSHFFLNIPWVLQKAIFTEVKVLCMPISFILFKYAMYLVEESYFVVQIYFSASINNWEKSTMILGLSSFVSFFFVTLRMNW